MLRAREAREDRHRARRANYAVSTQRFNRYRENGKKGGRPPKWNAVLAIARGQEWSARSGQLPKKEDCDDSSSDLPSYVVVRKLFGTMSAYREAL